MNLPNEKIEELYELCVSYIHAYARKAINLSAYPLSYEDLIQEGSLAFMRSVNKFNSVRRVSFQTYFVSSLIHAYINIIKGYERENFVSFNSAIEKEIPDTSTSVEDKDFIGVLGNLLGEEEKGVFEELQTHNYWDSKDSVNEPELGKAFGKSRTWTCRRMYKISKKACMLSGDFLYRNISKEECYA